MSAKTLPAKPSAVILRIAEQVAVEAVEMLHRRVVVLTFHRVDHALKVSNALRITVWPGCAPKIIRLVQPVI